jgi:hypothetical protein
MEGAKREVGRGGDKGGGEKKKKKKKAKTVEIQTPVWQAQGCLSWLRDVALAETAPQNPAVVECFATVSG